MTELRCKRAKVDLTTDSTACPIQALLKPGCALAPFVQFLADSLESPYDWHFIHAACSGLRHLQSQVEKCVEHFRDDMKNWDVTRLSAEAAKDAPDGDRILFLGSTMGSKPGYGGLRMVQELLTTLELCMRKDRVVGWEDKEDSSGWFRVIEDETNIRIFGESPKDKWSPQLIDRGIVGQVVTMMERYPDSPGVQKCCCAVLWALDLPSKHPLLQKCCFLLVDALQSCPDDDDEEELQKYAILAIHRLQRGHDFWLFSVETVQAILRAMENPSSHLEEVGLKTLSCLIQHVPSEDDADGMLLVALMKAASSASCLSNPQLLKVVWQGIVKRLKRGDCMDEFLKHKGLKKICKTLHHFQGHDPWSHGAWLRISLSKAWRIVCKEAAEEVTELHVENILGALERDQVRYSAMKNYSIAFGHLAQRSDSWREWLLSNGVVRVIVRCMEALKDEHENLGWTYNESRLNKRLSSCSFALSHLYPCKEHSLRTIRLVLWAMRRSKEEAIALNGAMLLSKLSATDVAKATAFHACETLAEAMAAHHTDKMQLEGCRAFLNLFHSKPNKTRLAAVGGVSMILNAIEQFPESIRIKTEGQKLLASMSEDVAAVALAPELRLVQLFRF